MSCVKRKKNLHRLVKEKTQHRYFFLGGCETKMNHFESLRSRTFFLYKEMKEYLLLPMVLSKSNGKLNLLGSVFFPYTFPLHNIIQHILWCCLQVMSERISTSKRGPVPLRETPLKYARTTLPDKHTQIEPPNSSQYHII